MEGISINKIRLKELDSFIKSPLYINQKHIPISKYRVASYISNPRKNIEQYVLYLALINDRIVGYRTIYQDALLSANEMQEFGWFSGNWVDPEFRRLGISSMLFNEVKNDWQERLMYTNYAPASKALYDKQGIFETYKSVKGIRYYLVPEIYNLLKERLKLLQKLKAIVLLFEFILKILVSPYLLIIKRKWVLAYNKVEVLDSPTNEVYEFLDNNRNSVFNRGAEEYKWIYENPWIIEEKANVNYAFTYQVNIFNLKYIVSRDNDNRICNLAIVKNVNGRASVPYFILNQVNRDWIRAIVGFAYSSKANILTIYSPELIKALKLIGRKALFHKKMIQNYYIMKSFNAKLKNKGAIEVQDGDGDVIFT